MDTKSETLKQKAYRALRYDPNMNGVLLGFAIRLK
jgi:hypothetical protein